MHEQVKQKWCPFPSDKTPGNQRDVRPLMLLPLFGWRKGKMPLGNDGWTFDVWLLCLERSNGMRVSCRNVPAVELNCSNSLLWCNIRLGFLMIALLIQAREFLDNFLNSHLLHLFVIKILIFGYHIGLVFKFYAIVGILQPIEIY